ncbi:MAG: MFS transporter [Chloroflexota bacterium]|jgi:fucose permease
MNQPTTSFSRDRFTWLAYLMLAYFAFYQSSIGPIMPFLRDELNLTYTVGGYHFSAFALGAFLAGLSGERFAKRFGRRKVFWGGAVGMTAGALWLVLADQVSQTIAAALLMGFLGTLLLVIIQASLSDHHGNSRAIALTESNVGASMAAGLAPLLIGAATRLGFGWRAAILAGVLALIALGLRYRQQPIPEAPITVVENEGRPRQLPRLYWAYWLVMTLGVAIEWSLVFWGADFLNSVVGLSRTNAVTLMSVFFLAMVSGRFAGSRLTRRMPAANLLLLALAVALLGFLLYWLAVIPAANVIGLFVAGLGVANLFPLTLSVATSVAAEQANRASARMSMGGGLAVLIVPLVLGWTADRIGLKDAFAIVVGLFAVAGAVAVLANFIARSEEAMTVASSSTAGNQLNEPNRGNGPESTV